MLSGVSGGYGASGKGGNMSARLIDSGGGTILNKSTPSIARRSRPRVVVAGGVLAGRVAELLRTHGWDVHTAETADAAAHLAEHKHAAAVLLPVVTESESGYLSCVKLLQTRPGLTVILVGRERTAWAEHLAAFVGGTFATEAALGEIVAKLVV